MGHSWTEHDIGDLTGRTAIVTGANSGVGYETARALAAHGAHVVLACRDTGRGRQAAARIADTAPGARVEVAELDLGDLSSVRRFAQTCLARHATIDILVNNAGFAGGPLTHTVDGFEKHFGTNHLGHFALTGRLFPALRDASGARVVTVSSTVAARARIELADDPSRYRFVAAYGGSKLANLMFALELDRRTRSAGLDLASLASHPGIAASNMLRGKPGITAFVLASGQRLLSQPAAAGALPSLRAATDPTLRGGQYVGPGGRGQRRGDPVVVRPPKAALDPAAARALWEASVERTGVSFDIPVAHT
jgi:NAD(P)-dependent dehydrogenase (short-subunit alcohol dehydrogenase family)